MLSGMGPSPALPTQPSCTTLSELQPHCGEELEDVRKDLFSSLSADQQHLLDFVGGLAEELRQLTEQHVLAFEHFMLQQQHNVGAVSDKRVVGSGGMVAVEVAAAGLFGDGQKYSSPAAESGAAGTVSSSFGTTSDPTGKNLSVKGQDSYPLVTSEPVASVTQSTNQTISPNQNVVQFRSNVGHEGSVVSTIQPVPSDPGTRVERAATADSHVLQSVSEFSSLVKPGLEITSSTKSKYHQLQEDQRSGTINCVFDLGVRLAAYAVPRNPRLRYFRHLIESQVFGKVVVTLILLNAMFTAAEVDRSVREAITAYWRAPDSVSELVEPAWVQTTTYAFTGCFIVELLLRLLALELGFWVGPDWRWNMLDLILVLTSILDIMLAAAGSRLTFVRTFRLLRMLRSVRVIRVLRFFRKLRLLLLSVLNSVLPLFWSLVFLFFVLFIFVVISLQGAHDYISSADARDEEFVGSMGEYFGNLPMALLTHWMAISGGLNWWELIQILSRASQLYSLVFVFYELVMVLMVLNIITGIFVNDAVELANTDRILACLAETDRNRSIFNELHYLFKQLDTDGSDKITFAEFEDRIKLPEVAAIFSALNIDLADANRCFGLLDADGSQQLEIDEFVVGCMNLKGFATTVSMEAIFMENKKFMKLLSRTSNCTNMQFNVLEVNMQRILGLLGQMTNL